MPLDNLCNDILNGEVPREIKKADRAAASTAADTWSASASSSRARSTKSWMYFPEDNCPFYRVTYLSNYSPVHDAG